MKVLHKDVLRITLDGKSEVGGVQEVKDLYYTVSNETSFFAPFRTNIALVLAFKRSPRNSGTNEILSFQCVRVTYKSQYIIITTAAYKMFQYISRSSYINKALN